MAGPYRSRLQSTPEIKRPLLTGSGYSDVSDCAFHLHPGVAVQSGHGEARGIQVNWRGWTGQEMQKRVVGPRGEEFEYTRVPDAARAAEPLARGTHELRGMRPIAVTTRSRHSVFCGIDQRCSTFHAVRGPDFPGDVVLVHSQGPGRQYDPGLL